VNVAERSLLLAPCAHERSELGKVLASEERQKALTAGESRQKARFEPLEAHFTARTRCERSSDRPHSHSPGIRLAGAAGADEVSEVASFLDLADGSGPLQRLGARVRGHVRGGEVGV